ncbi:MAG: 23S rRNA (uracil(1939)-C(5))-methyltransferase RlmD [Anaerolineales bacterium]|nr:MAG: 23S rRNA (uracil(1939)-C(5))-methyltransferase RlmD [Anaerolineales bacterium]
MPGEKRRLNEPFTIELTGMANGGPALGRHEGRVVFVPYALAGETVRAEISDDRERYAFARLLEVLEPSPDRVEPPCPYFGPRGCGGCQWQHISYEAQLRFKAEIMADQLERIGGVADASVLPPAPDSTGWAYRNHAQLHPAVGGGLGFRATGSDDVVTVDECLILHPLLGELLGALDLELPNLSRLSIRAGTATGETMIIFETEDDVPPGLELDLPVSCVQLLSDGRHANLIGSNFIHETVANRSYRISAPSFFQINSPQAAVLLEKVLGYVNLQPDETVLDAYCGVGLFTAQLAPAAGLVVAIEVSAAAVDDLMENTAEFENVQIIEGSLEEALPELDIPFDVAVIDPPRSGIDRHALDALTERSRPERIVYVSCDPATLARDAKRLIRTGYELREVQPVDMFPQTHHVESVACFERQ